jgi:myo-inositol-1(or 4)-monophosphatase
MKETMLAGLKIGGEILLNYFDQHLEGKIKESQSSIVTQADLKSDSLIVRLIRDRYPDHNIISEEGGYIYNNSEYTWVIDPLDGTSNFASSIPWFGILIALFENNTPIMGGAYLPIQDQLYFAEKDKGVYLNGNQFKMKKNKGLRNSLISFCTDYTNDELLLDQSVRVFKNLVKASRNIRSTNSLIDFLYVAEGKFGGCINLFTRIWDISALGLILSEAGGTMKSIKGQEIEFQLNEKITKQNFAVMAGSEEIIREFRKVVF